VVFPNGLQYGREWRITAEGLFALGAHEQERIQQ
jgi:hypothetical protein